MLSGSEIKSYHILLYPAQLYSTQLYSALPFSALSHNQPKFFSLLLSTSTVSLRIITTVLVQVNSDSIHELALVFILQLYCIF